MILHPQVDTHFDIHGTAVLETRYWLLNSRYALPIRRNLTTGRVFSFERSYA